MFNKIISGGVSGLEGMLVQVETDVSDGLPMFSMVGYLSACVKEAGERVRTALKNSNYHLPPKRITVNLSPADVKKEGTCYDLPIALGILCCMGNINGERLEHTMVIGELSLDGRVNPVNGVLSMVHYACKEGIRRAIVPKENAKEAALVRELEVIGVESLEEAVSYIEGSLVIEPEYVDTEKLLRKQEQIDEDFSEIKGQETLKRGMEIAVAGLHNILMTGAAGAGKSMIAKRAAGIMPWLTFEESIEITKIYSVAGLLDSKEALITKRPFRAPHHTISPVAMAGGGSHISPGELSLSHGGILFLDELPEFPRNVLEVLRQPLEDREIHISRINNTYTFPADFMLIAARNMCPCGAYPDMSRCTCSLGQIRRYNARISRPLLDRIDISVDVMPVGAKELFENEQGESSDVIRERVYDAQRRQSLRYKNEKFKFNSQLNGNQVNKYVELKDSDVDFLEYIYEEFDLSARGCRRIMKVARTIADLDGEEEIRERHLREAVFYRNGEEKAGV